MRKRLLTVGKKTPAGFGEPERNGVKSNIAFGYAS